jgi:hypothetical protein
VVLFFSPQKEHNLAFGCWQSWKSWQTEESKIFLLDFREKNLFSRAKEKPKCPLFPAEKTTVKGRWAPLKRGKSNQ